jgi:hypothetical protein
LPAAIHFSTSVSRRVSRTGGTSVGLMSLRMVSCATVATSVPHTRLSSTSRRASAPWLSMVKLSIATSPSRVWTGKVAPVRMPWEAASSAKLRCASVWYMASDQTSGATDDSACATVGSSMA